MADPARTNIRLRKFHPVRLLSVSLGILFYLLIHSTATVQAQSCPTSLEGYPEVVFVSSKNYGCKEVKGGTQCDLGCYYKITNRRAPFDDMSIVATWFSKKFGEIYNENTVCGNRGIMIGGQVSRTHVAWLSVYGLDTFDKISTFKALNAFLPQIESLGVACPVKTPAIPPKAESGKRLGPLPPDCSPGSPPKPRGKIRNPVGKVEFYAYAFDKWKTVVSEVPVFPCDMVRTGDQSSATVFIFTPSGGEDRIDMGQDTILEIPGLMDIEIPNTITPAPSEGYIIDLIQGTIRWATPETPVPPREREGAVNSPNSPFNVRTPTVNTATRGTDFVLRHDPVEKKDYILLHSGKLEVAAGGKNVLLEAGQQMFTENKKLSPVFELKPEVWNSVVERRTIPSRAIFAGARQVETKVNDGGKGKEDPKGGEPNNTKVAVVFQGRRYITLYQRQSHDGTPIDLYFFEIRAPDGSHAEQDGAKLWGRFVRNPAVGIETKDGVQWWYVDWIFKSGRWEAVTSKGEPFQVLGTGN